MPFTEGPGSGDTGYGSDGGWIGAAIQTGAALYDSSQDRKTAKRNTDKTIAANKAEAELAYQRSVQNWERQMAYNSPEAQMQRFKDAGLNPHLIYGQGSPGNAESPPSYQPPDVQYRYQSGRYGEAIGSFLPTLMSVGTWLQNMRATEAGIKKTEVETMRSDQLIDYLEKANPEILKKLQGEVSLIPGRKELQDIGRDKAIQALRDLEMDFRQKYGDDLWKEFGSNFKMIGRGVSPIGGTKALEYLQEKQKVLQAESKTKLLGAQASWADMDITNPQQIMLLVLNGIMGMAGASLRNRAGKAMPNTNQVKARPKGLRRVHPSRRVQSKPKGYYD